MPIHGLIGREKGNTDRNGICPRPIDKPPGNEVKSE